MGIEDGRNLDEGITNNQEAANGWEDTADYESDFMAAYAARALQRSRRAKEKDPKQDGYEPAVEYKQRRKRIEQNLGHIGTSILDVRDKTTDRQAIQRELQDYGVDDISELADSVDAWYEREHRIPPEQVFERFRGLFEFLGENTEGDPHVVNDYRQITDTKERLRFILTSSLSDKVMLFCSDDFGYSNYNHFIRRLQSRQDFIENYKDMDPESIACGLKRDALYSAMIGSPELASVKIATARINSMMPEGRTIKEAVCLHGFESGVDTLNNSDIGQWADLCDEYKSAYEKIAVTYKDDSPERKEYEAVRKLATWIEGAYDYAGGQIQASESPYVAELKEAIVAGRLSYGAMRQFKGMRLKIGSNLNNIERFIGKSGCSQKCLSMQSAKSRLHNRLGYIGELSDGDRQEFLNQENSFEIRKQREWREKELDRIQHKYDKLIGRTRSEERREAYEQRRQEELQRIEQDVSGRIAYFENRTMTDLIADTQTRIDTLSRQIEKRKSLAEKAIDLHFALNGMKRVRDDEYEEYEYFRKTKYKDSIDWINDASFGTIKRAHQRMIDGMPADEVYEEAICETIRKAVSDPDQAEAAMRQLFDGAGRLKEIGKITRLASKLSKYAKELNYSELVSMSSKDTRWIEDSLAAFPLSDVKTFIDKGLNLSIVPTLSRVAKKFGYELDIDKLIELSSKEIINSYDNAEVEAVFTSALRRFSLDDLMVAMDANVGLTTLTNLKKSLRLGEEWTIERYVKSAKIVETTGMRVESFSKYIRNGQLNLDVLEEYPWLQHQYSDESCGNADVFPANKSDSAKYKWCSDNSFIWLDGAWGRQTLGKLIFTRLQSGVDESIHDATQWLSFFQIPEVTYDIPEIKRRVEGKENIDVKQFTMRLFDKNDEKAYVARILSAPLTIRNRLNLSTKPQNMSRLFSSPEHMFIYGELVKVLRKTDINLDEFNAAVRGGTKDFFDNNIADTAGKNSEWRMSFEDFEKKVSDALDSILQIAQSGDEYPDRIGDVAQRLTRYGLNRKAYIDNTTSWLVKHTVSPQQSLTRAWVDRPLAIANGVEDTASEINKWANVNALIEGHGEFLRKNGISNQDLTTTYKPFVEELTRCYGARTTAGAIVEYKNIHNPKKLLPAACISLEVGGRNFTAEILAHDDPRGMTIGQDTGCCMTVEGASADCIRSGYRDAGAGFFAFYDANNRLNAQSYFFTDPNYPEVVVMDNIEANKGRDSSRIINVYQEFFRQYLKDRFANDPDWKIRQVNVGTRYGDVAKAQVRMLKSTEIVPNNLSSYSDAREDQRILLRLSDAEIAEARGSRHNVVSVRKVESNHSPVPLASPLGINQLPILRSLESQIYPDSMTQYDDDDFVYEELTMPGVDKYSFLIKLKNDAINEASGYCLAYEEKSMSDPNYPDKVVYVADFGILQNARSLTTALRAFDELVKRADENGVRKIEMEARESTSYKLLNSDLGRRYFAKKGYNLVVHDRIQYFGDDEKTYLISLEKQGV